MCIQLILTTATILPINVVDTASVSDLVLTTNLGIQFECYYIVTEEIQEREEQEESASILITPATTPATTPPSKKRVGHAKV
ncbi:uncharacterized protein OCT59_027067 [Rhizophagus irregularis]|uniref:uncharacterized protein n=1 Tax=Rhizophagus irregularis TaxID=588596 RepID=UPI003320D535|nr:hypothetical protein OCT59_027067 [Rhizophagus irregularis]